MLKLVSAVAIVAMPLAIRGVAAQAVELSKPNASLSEEFSSVRGVRELADGRVLVSDYRDQRVVIVDFERGTVAAMVRVGSGPTEARLPTRLIPFTGDSTLLADLGNNRLLVLDGQGRPARTIILDKPGLMGVRGVDAAGRMYYAVPGWAESQAPLANDSVRVVRWNPKTGASEVVAIIQGERMRSDIRKPALTPRIPTVGFASQDAWLLADGVVRIVRGGDYRIERIPPGSTPSAGPSHAYETRPVTAADRVEYVRVFNASSPMSGRGDEGGMGFSPALSDAELAAMVKGTEFAERHPMFSPTDVIAAPGGRLWVGRPSQAGKPAHYDVFDEGGRRVQIVTLRPGRRSATVGRRGVIVVAESDVGIQQLERYELPR